MSVVVNFLTSKSSYAKPVKQKEPILSREEEKQIYTNKVDPNVIEPVRGNKIHYLKKSFSQQPSIEMLNLFVQHYYGM